MNNIYPYKGRHLDKGMPVKIYRNLNCRGSRNRYSMMQRGLVVAHTDRVLLRDCKFVVSEAGRQRVLKTKRKNVHAFMVGFVAGTWHGFTARNGIRKAHGIRCKITYNPYKNWSFMWVDFHVGHAHAAIISPAGVFGVCLS